MGCLCHFVDYEELSGLVPKYSTGSKRSHLVIKFLSKCVFLILCLQTKILKGSCKWG